MNGTNYLLGALHQTRCGFASITAFAETIEPWFGGLAFDHDSVAARVLEVVAELRRHDGPIDPAAARDLLVAEDLERAVAVLDRVELTDPKQALLDRLDTFAEALAEEGLGALRPEVFIVDAFPAPYDSMDWIATSPDTADEADYGIRPGTYFKRAHLVPVKSEFLLAHEILHQIIGGPDARWLGRGLEEGIAVVFGELYIGARVLGGDLAYLYTTYSWFDDRASRVNRLYVEYARMATLVYQRYGLDGIVALIRGGRPEVKRVEGLLYSGRFDLELPAGRWDDDYSDLLARVALATIGDLTVSPLAKYVSRFVTVGATTATVADASGVPVELVVEAFEELQGMVFAMLADGGRVDYSDVDTVIPDRVLRYRL